MQGRSVPFLGLSYPGPSLVPEAFEAHHARQVQKLDAAFQRANYLQGDAELLSDFARHLCVLVAGFLEQAVIELALEHVRSHSQVSVQRYAEQRLRPLTNVKTQRLIEVLGSFDPGWGKTIESYLVDEYRDAVDGVVDLRDRISHGHYAGITMGRVQDGRVKVLVERVADLGAPR